MMPHPPQRRPIFALLLCCALLPLHHASATLGNLKGLINLPATRFAVDPIRPRLYASLTASNSIAVIDTNTLGVVQIIPIGSAPVGLTISPDGNTLYVANSGSTLNGVGAIDLNTLQVLQTISLPQAPCDIAAGLNGQLYLAPENTYISQLMQVSTGGTGQTLFGSGFFVNALGYLRISPDLSTLYFGNANQGPTALATFDVTSSGTAPLLQENSSTLGSSGQDLELSHSGAFLSFPNTDSQGNNGIFEIPTGNLAAVTGTFATGKYPANIAFSPDDTFAYTAPQSQQRMMVFNTSTFALSGTFALPGDVLRLVTDNSGGRLFVAALVLNTSTPAGIYTYDTGRAAAYITSTNAVTAQVGASFGYNITATGSPLSYNATGLPPGLSIDPANGTISGTCTTPGFSEVVISASNSIGVGMAYLSITAGPPPTDTLTVSVSGSGAVTSALSGSSSQVIGSTVSISATAAPGSVFAGWTGDIVSHVNPLNFIFESATSVQANFVPATLGAVDATFNIPAAEFALDPVRPRMYATVTASNCVAVIDTSTLKLVTLLPTGSSPVGLTVSPDGSRLYVANSGSASAGVGVVDLTTLTLLPSLATPQPPSDIALGADGYLYLTPLTYNLPSDLMQVSITGASQVSFNNPDQSLLVGGGGYLQVSPDQNTLYFGTGGNGESTLATFDVSSGTPVYLQANSWTEGGGGSDLELSHSGALVTYPNSGTPGSTFIYEFPAGAASVDFSAYHGSFAGPLIKNVVPVSIAYSPNDDYAYATPFDANETLVYDTNSFAVTGTFPSTNANRLKTDSSGKYLFAASADTNLQPVSIKVYDTGRPATVITSAAAITTDTGYPFNYQITATYNPTSYNATGLPAGLSINTATGQISGTTTTAGISPVVLSASNSIGVAMADLTITTFAGAAPALVSSTQSGLGYGNKFSYQIMLSGTGPFTYGASGLPAGLAINPSTGLISGSLGDAGNFPVIISATNNYVGSYGTATLDLQINAMLTVTSGEGGFTSMPGVTYQPLGSTVSLSATPDTGYLFQDWTGPFTTSSNPLQFTMSVTDQWTANFASSSTYVGTYTSVVSSTTPAAISTGLLTIKLLNTGVFTGSLTIGGVRYPITGFFPPANSSTITINRLGGQPPISLDLSLILSGSTPVLTGTASDGVWTSDLSTSLTTVYPPTVHCPLAGLYTVALYSSTTSTTVPAGAGYATISVSNAGAARFTGALADGTPFLASATITPGGVLPIYIPLYASRGALAGNLTFDSASNVGELSGTLGWWKPVTTIKPYTAAFSTAVNAQGSSYFHLAGISGTGGTITCTGGQVSGTFSEPVTISPLHKVVIPLPGAKSITFAVAPTTGIFAGTFLDGTRRIALHGVILQQQDTAAGYFLDPAGSGPVNLNVSP